MVQSVLALLQNHVLILRHFTALRPEKKTWSFSQVVWVIRNSDSTTIFLGVLKYWKPSCIVFLFRGSEILYPLLCCLGNQKFWILSCVVWGIRNSKSPVLFGNQKFRISCVVWESEIQNLLCCLGDQKFWIPSVVWGIRNSESSPVLFRGSLGNCLEEFYDPLQTGRRFLWVLTPV